MTTAEEYGKKLREVPEHESAKLVMTIFWMGATLGILVGFLIGMMVFL